MLADFDGDPKTATSRIEALAKEWVAPVSEACRQAMTSPQQAALPVDRVVRHRRPAIRSRATRMSRRQALSSVLARIVSAWTMMSWLRPGSSFGSELTFILFRLLAQD